MGPLDFQYVPPLCTRPALRVSVGGSEMVARHGALCNIWLISSQIKWPALQYKQAHIVRRALKQARDVENKGVVFGSRTTISIL